MSDCPFCKTSRAVFRIDPDFLNDRKSRAIYNEKLYVLTHLSKRPINALWACERCYHSLCGGKEHYVKTIVEATS